MGASYVNYTIKGANQQSAVRALKGRNAFVSTAQNDNLVVVVEQESDNQDQSQISRLAAQISTALRCTVFAVLLHDSDILWYQLYQNGKLSDQYNSTPGYGQSNREPLRPAGGDAKRLCSVLGCQSVDRVESILRATTATYFDAMNRHADLVQTLGLPDFAVGYGFNSAKQGYLPKGLSPENMIASHSELAPS